MGWSNWFSDGNDSVTEKTVQKDNGDVERHTLRSTGDDRSNHSHTVVVEKSSGRSSAHHNPAKDKR